MLPDHFVRRCLMVPDRNAVRQRLFYSSSSGNQSLTHTRGTPWSLLVTTHLYAATLLTNPSINRALKIHWWLHVTPPFHGSSFVFLDGTCTLWMYHTMSWSTATETLPPTAICSSIFFFMLPLLDAHEPWKWMVVDGSQTGSNTLLKVQN
jgi:hypothetical protein